MKKIVLIFVAILLLAASCYDKYKKNDAVIVMQDRDCMYQVATLKSLMVGLYDGYMSVGELRQHGDIGIGTFDRIDGEMTMLDGVVYQAVGDGSVHVADDSTLVPFATTTFFDADIKTSVSAFENIQTLAQSLDSIIAISGKNQIYQLRMAVQCNTLTVRSEVAQNHPYRPLVETMVDAQREFTYGNVNGTLVAVYFPSFFTAENTPGWHFHFVSSDYTKGGHVLKISVADKAEVQLDVTPRFQMYLPEGKDFNDVDLTPDLTKEIKKVEQ